MRLGSPKLWLLLALALALVGLALPWATILVVEPGGLICYPDAWGGTWCTTYTNTRPAPIQGYETPARVYVAMAVVLTVVAVRQLRRSLAVGALVAGVVAVCIDGVPSYAGSVLGLVALVVLAVALYGYGLLPIPRFARQAH